MGELTRGERMQIMLTESEQAALDDWRFAKRMPSRASAVRELLKRGLAAEGFATAKMAPNPRTMASLTLPRVAPKNRASLLPTDCGGITHRGSDANSHWH